MIAQPTTLAASFFFLVAAKWRGMVKPNLEHYAQALHEYGYEDTAGVLEEATKEDMY